MIKFSLREDGAPLLELVDEVDRTNVVAKLSTYAALSATGVGIAVAYSGAEGYDTHIFIGDAQTVSLLYNAPKPVSYTHLTLPTIYSV